MGFFGSAAEISKSARGQMPSLDLLHRNGCRICPLDRINIYSPKMNASGSDTPLIYVLGEAPGRQEDEVGTQFVGISGNLLRNLIPPHFIDKIRFNNTINCRPPNNRDPEQIELECCRPRLEKDIEETKPIAIFAFGNFPLEWCCGKSGITNWRGRRLPVKIGSHVCWLYPFFHPSALLRVRRGRNKDIISEDERATQFDLKRAFAEIESLKPPVVHSETTARANVVCLDGSGRDHLQRLLAFLKRASEAPYAGVDYETSTKRPYASEARILSAAVSLPDTTVSFALWHAESKWGVEELQSICTTWRAFLSSKTRKVSHGLHFELEWSIVVFGVEHVNIASWEDTMTQAHVLDERVGGKVCFGLGFLTTQYFGLDIKTLSHLNRRDMAKEKLADILPYNGIDAKYHRLLWEEQTVRLAAEQLDYQYELLLRRVPTAVLTEIKGIPIDLELNAELAEQYQKNIDDVEARIKALPECKEFERQRRKPFKPGAPLDVKIMLKDIIKLDVDLESTNKALLNKINHPFPPLIIEYREAVKLKSTYVDSFREATCSDGSVHQELQTLFVTTSRGSSDSPNCKNLPKRDEEAKIVRKQIKAPPGYLIACFDAGQIQVRNVAMESQDPVLCRYIWDEHDMHGEWSKKIAYKCPQVIGGKEYLHDEKVMKAFRNTCKSGWTFCLLFGGQLYTAATYLNLPEMELAPLYDEFWETFSGVHDWHNETIKMYKEVGYVENLSGRRRRAPVAQNQLINAPIQADEAEIVWDAYNRLSELGDPVYQPINEIYDDLTFMLPLDGFANHVDKIADELTRVTFPWINVPLVWELSFGENLADLANDVARFNSVTRHGTPFRPSYA